MTDDIWQELADDEILHVRTLPEDLALTLTIAGEHISFNIPEKTHRVSSTPSPRIYLLSSSETTPFLIDLTDRSSGESCRITNGPDGLVLVEGGSGE